MHGVLSGVVCCEREHPTRMLFFFLDSLMSSLLIVETQKSKRNVSSVDRRETGLFSWENDVIVWDPGL